ncbi:MAG: PAS domain-containing protein [Desulfobulbaceae bacterium]|nr:MAG: PAS domain-containing protein [Desulfobulbaceae bacterium]
MSFFPLNSTIARDLVRWFIIVSTLVALLSTGVQLYLDYRHDLEIIDSYFASIDDSYLPSIAKSTWVMDDHQINTLLEGITNREDIVYAAIVIDDSIYWQSGEQHLQKSITHTFPIRYVYQNQPEEIGTLTVTANLEGVYQRLVRRFTIVLFSNGIKTFIVAGLALVIVQLIVTRHLQAMASHVRRLTINTPQPPLILQKPEIKKNELDEVNDALNLLLKRSYSAFNAIQTHEQKLRLFLNSTEEAVVGVDRSGRVTFANKVFLRLTGQSEGQNVSDQHLSELILCDCLITENGNHLDTPLYDAIHAGRAYSCDDTFVTNDITPGFYASIRSYPTYSNSECSGAVIFITDITDKRKMKREMELLRKALGHSHASVVITDRDFRIVYVNPIFEKGTGRSFAELENQKVDIISNEPEFARACQEAIANNLSGKSWQGRMKYTNKNKNLRTIEVVASPVYDDHDEIINFIAVSHDVTIEAAVQEQLMIAQKHKALSRLSASIAHEFGNPLLGILSLLKDFATRNSLGKNDKELMDIAISECQRLQSLISDIETFYGSGIDDMQGCDLHQIIEKVLFFHKRTFLEHSIQTSFNPRASEAEVMGHPDQLAQVILHLVINAVNAIDKDQGQISISTQSGDGTIAIRITDNGKGISQWALPHIFEPFYSTKEQIEGTGLGLPVSYGIITSHGGDLTCQSELGKRTTFTISLPLMGSSHPASGSSSQGSPTPVSAT